MLPFLFIIYASHIGHKWTHTQTHIDKWIWWNMPHKIMEYWAYAKRTARSKWTLSLLHNYIHLLSFQVFINGFFVMLSCVSFSGVHCIFYKGLSTTNIILYFGLFMFEMMRNRPWFLHIPPPLASPRPQSKPIHMHINTISHFMDFYSLWKMEYIIKQLIVSSKQ